MCAALLAAVVVTWGWLGYELHFSALLELEGRDPTPDRPGCGLAPDTQGLQPQGSTHLVLQLELF